MLRARFCERGRDGGPARRQHYCQRQDITGIEGMTGWLLLMKFVFIGRSSDRFGGRDEGRENIRLTGAGSSPATTSRSRFVLHAGDVPRRSPSWKASTYDTGIKGWLTRKFMAGVGQVPIDATMRCLAGGLNTGVGSCGRRVLGIYPEGPVPGRSALSGQDRGRPYGSGGGVPVIRASWSIRQDPATGGGSPAAAASRCAVSASRLTSPATRACP